MNIVVVARFTLVVLLVAAGMAGLYLQIPFSGWVLAVGLVGALA